MTSKTRPHCGVYNLGDSVLPLDAETAHAFMFRFPSESCRLNLQLSNTHDNKQFNFFPPSISPGVVKRHLVYELEDKVNIPQCVPSVNLKGLTSDLVMDAPYVMGSMTWREEISS